MGYRKQDRETLERYVAIRVGALQSRFIKEVPSARAQLAKLRKTVTLRPGAVPDVWELEFEGLPKGLGGRSTEDATPAEWALHLAFALYAVHQQSQSREMHQRTNVRRNEFHGLGHAVRDMVYRDYANDSGERLEQGEMPSRFAALVTAEAIEEVAHYGRQIVQQLRSAGISLDYARLAAQLYGFQYPEHRNRVRLEWAREFAQWRGDISLKTVGNE